MLSKAIATAIGELSAKLKSVVSLQDRFYQVALTDSDFTNGVYYNPLDSVEMESKKPFNGIEVTNFSNQRVTLKLNNVDMRVPTGGYKKVVDYPIESIHIVKDTGVVLDDEIEVIISKELTFKEVIRNF